MADVKKIATRESYGNTLKELAAEGHDDLVVLDADLAAATKPACPPWAMCPLFPALPCLPPAVPLSRCATPSATPT